MSKPPNDGWNRGDHFYDPALLAYVVSVFDPLRPVVDVGANIGHVTRFLALRTRSAVRAYEPSRENFKTLRANVAGLPNVTLINAAVGKSSGTISFGDGGTVTSHVATTHTKKHLRDVKVVTLDDDVGDLDVGTIKVDVEGFEMSVLAGARRLIERRRPVVILEVIDGHLSRFGWRRIDVLNFFRSRDYRGPVDKFGRRTDDAEDLVFAPRGVYLPKLYIPIEKSLGKYPEGEEW